MNRVPLRWPHTAPVALYGALAQRCQVCSCQAITILESQGSGTGPWGLAAFLIPVIAEAMPEQTKHKCSGGGVRIVFRKHHKPLFVRVQRHRFADERGRRAEGPCALPFSTVFPSGNLRCVPAGLEAAHLSTDLPTTAALPCSPSGPGGLGFPQGAQEILL